ncbi:hypothetical protein [Erwinia typographi]|uniref:hypothetical protein n=1 Tax=Erwinia typographi TaxID=371042 RepID=UPI000AA30858|nr:hypothetical protein [Erwinia typographi]
MPHVVIPSSLTFLSLTAFLTEPFRCPGAGVIPAGHGCRASHRASGLSLPGPSGPAALREQRASILTQHLTLAAAVPAAPLSPHRR